MVLWANLQQPVVTNIIESSATPDADGLVEVRIVIPSPRSEATETRLVRIPPERVDDGTLEIWWADQIGGEILLEDPGDQVTTGDYILGAGLGFLLGLVVLGSLRGYGYVRGDGEPGSKPKVPVGEERGFYWRT
jgi:hypothetical protein